MNTMKDIKDYLHLYVGCTLRCDTGFVILMSVIPEIIPHTSFGIAVINGSESYRTNLGDYRPVLRPLSDITEEEKKWLNEHEKLKDEFIGLSTEVYFLIEWQAEKIRYLLCKGFDLFSLIPEELAIDKTRL